MSISAPREYIKMSHSAGVYIHDPPHLSAHRARARQLLLGFEFGPLVVHGVAGAADGGLAGGFGLQTERPRHLELGRIVL